LGFTLNEIKQLLELRLAHGKDVEPEEDAAQSGVEHK
jgi:DNA-binding transcriptional MerR regulator